MINIEFDNSQLSIPSEWADIKLCEYEKWYGNRPKNKMEYIAHLAAICKIDTTQLLNLPADTFGLITTATQFVTQDVAPEQYAEINGQKYFVVGADKITLGEWIDVDEVLNRDSGINLSELLAIVCRPLCEAYNHEQTAARAELFSQQTCDVMLPLFSFFLLKGQRLKETLNHCLAVAEVANQFLADTKTFVESGDGIKQLPIWQRIRYFSLIKSLEKQLSKFSDLCSIELINHMLNETK